jgi:hypothetical protein
MCVAGDFNMTVGGRIVRDEAKKILQEGLSDAGLSCVTRAERIPGMLKPLIDHICLPEAWALRSRVVEASPGTMMLCASVITAPLLLRLGTALVAGEAANAPTRIARTPLDSANF